MRVVIKNSLTMKWYFAIYLVLLISRYFSVYSLKTKYGDFWWAFPIGIDVIGFVLYFIVSCKNPGNIKAD